MELLASGADEVGRANYLSNYVMTASSVITIFVTQFFGISPLQKASRLFCQALGSSLAEADGECTTKKNASSFHLKFHICFF